MFHRRNKPCPVPDLGKSDKKVTDHVTGDAGKDGFTRLSRAEPATGHRRTHGTDNQGFYDLGYRPIVYED
jgi:hypothetical protein